MCRLFYKKITAVVQMYLKKILKYAIIYRKLHGKIAVLFCQLSLIFRNGVFF